MKFEILAPAGSTESLIAGVRSGADAVYLGGKLFNARRSAGNFDDEELKKAADYCHQRGVKVYLTFNILTADSEFEQAYSAVKKAMEAGVDAFIVQDLGIAQMIRTHFPGARLHASTQTGIMTPSGVKYAQEAGFSRVVLPRELSISEIEEIRRKTTAELELFVHGALCMCVSGQCYFSSMLGSRSGNRGLCAQPCRLSFSAGGAGHYALSLKDMSLINDLDMLDGITSLKIEGRMKRPEYVSAAVTAVKRAVEGEYTADDWHRLRSVFSRSGFTDGYLKGKLGADMFGTRQKEDVVSARGVLKELARNYDREKPLVRLDLDFTCKSGENAVLTARALGREVTVTGDAPQSAVNRPMTESALKERLSKLGGTQFYPGEINIRLGGGLILPVSKINEMRRKAVEMLNEIPPVSFTSIEFIPVNREKKCEKPYSPYATASFSSCLQVPENHPFERIFIPLDSPLNAFAEKGAGVVLPRGLFGCEEKITGRLNELRSAGVKNALCGNIGSYNLARGLGFEVFGDFGLNVYNSVSAGLINHPILSFELTLSQANAVCAEDDGIIVYGRLPLMLTRNCPVKSSIGCEKCGKKGVLTDRRGVKFPVVCSAYPCSEILNSVPLYMLDLIDEVKTDFVHFYFSTESADEVGKIINMYKERAKPEFACTRGLYRRGTL